MKGTRIALLLVSILLVALLFGCGDNENNSSNSENTDNTNNQANNTDDSNSGNNEISEEEANKDVVYSYSVVMGEEVEGKNVREEFVLDKFKIKYDPKMYISEADFSQRVNILFASGDYPELFHSFFDENLGKQLGSQGFFQDLTQYLDKMPNYQAMWTDSEWETVMKLAGDSEGRLFYLPMKGSNLIGQTWVYRKDVFDDLGLEFPKTTDELYNVMKAIKAEYPESVPMTNRYGTDGLLEGFHSAFRTDKDFFTDPDAGDELVYGPTTDKYRDMLAFVNKLYEEDLIEKEFPTITDEQWRSRYPTNEAFIEHSYVGRDNLYEQWQQEITGVDWVWSEGLVSAYDEQAFALRGDPHLKWGPAITDKLEGDKLNRLLKYWDWAATEEGAFFHEYGIEGETYEMVDGVPKHIDDGTSSTHGLGTYIRPELEYSIENSPGLKAGYAVSDAQMDYPFIRPTVYNFTEEQQREVLNLEVVVKDMKDEYVVRFIMGQLDVTDDGDWQDYLDNMERSGLNDLLELKKAAVVK